MTNFSDLTWRTVTKENFEAMQARLSELEQQIADLLAADKAADPCPECGCTGFHARWCKKSENAPAEAPDPDDEAIAKLVQERDAADTGERITVEELERRTFGGAAPRETEPRCTCEYDPIAPHSHPYTSDPDCPVHGKPLPFPDGHPIKRRHGETENA
jgi:hypothetical protein